MKSRGIEDIAFKAFRKKAANAGIDLLPATKINIKMAICKHAFRDVEINEVDLEGYTDEEKSAEEKLIKIASWGQNGDIHLIDRACKTDQEYEDILEAYTQGAYQAMAEMTYRPDGVAFSLSPDNESVLEICFVEIEDSHPLPRHKLEYYGRLCLYFDDMSKYSLALILTDRYGNMKPPIDLLEIGYSAMEGTGKKSE